MKSPLQETVVVKSVEGHPRVETNEMFSKNFSIALHSFV